MYMWILKMKASGIFRARLLVRGYEQRDGEHYFSYDISSPVTNAITTRIVFVLMIMAGWIAHFLIDVKDAFLLGFLFLH
jgi:Reverse transcriptase (RNA-dependent DNA polymerase)